MSADLSGVRGFFTELGFDESTATNAIVLLNHKEGEELPEDLKYKSLTDLKNDYTQTREELILQRNREGIIAKHEKETQGSKWAEFSNPLLQYVKKEGNFQKEDLEGLQVKDAIKKLIDVKNKAILSASDTMDESHLNKITTLQDTNQDLLNKIEAMETQFATGLKEAKEESVKEIYNFHAESFVNNRIYSNDIAFDIPEKRGLYKQLIMPKIMDTYKVDYQTGAIRMKNGEKALAFDGNGYYDHVDQAIKALAKEMNILKLSNGMGGVPDAIDKKHVTIQGTKVDLAGTQMLKNMMG